MKRNLLFIAALFVSIISYGQGEMDAFRYSRNDLSGSARGLAMGGAFGALGADITGVSINPAGIGMYRSSEVVTTMNFSSTNIKTDWNGLSMKDDKFKFNFDNIAFMGYFPTGGETVRSYNFGFAYNRLKNFDRNYQGGGGNMPSSLTDYIAQKTYGINPSWMEDRKDNYPYSDNLPWLSILGFQGDLIAPNGVDNNGNQLYKSTWPANNEVDNYLSVSEKGSIDTYDFTGGVNIADNLYLGATFSITDIYYRMDSHYEETFYESGSTTSTGWLDLNNYYETNGTGYGLSVGLIYKPIDALRLGVAYHSPTWYDMTTYVYGETSSEYNKTIVDAWTPDNDIYYRYHTPYYWVFSAAAVIGTKAIVSVDYQITDYSSMKLKDEDGYEFNRYDKNVDNPNDFISKDFKMASILRAGLEVRATPQLSIRAGYAWMQSPLEANFKEGKEEVITVGTVPHYVLEGDAHNITFGLGYRLTKSFYVDAAFVYKTQEDELYAYSDFYQYENGIPTRLIVDSAPAKFTNNTYKGVLTLGYKF